MVKVLKGKKGEDNKGGKGATVCHTRLVHTYYRLEREGREIVSVLRIVLRESSQGTISSNNVSHLCTCICVYARTRTHTHKHTKSHTHKHRRIYTEAHVSPEGLNCSPHIPLSKDTTVLAGKSQACPGGSMCSHALWRAHSSPRWQA